MRRELRTLTIVLMVFWPLLVPLTRLTAPLFAQIDGSEVRLAPPSWVWAQWLLWSIFTPYVVRVLQRFPTAPARRARRAFLHLGSIVLFVSAHILAFAVIRRLAAGIEMTPSNVARIVPSAFRYGILNYTVIAVAVGMLRQQRGTRLSELTRSRLERELAASRIDNLIVALDGQWIFRTLDDAEQRLGRDRAGAEERVFALSRHLRDKLQHRLSNAAPVPPHDHVRPLQRSSRVAAAMFCTFSIYTSVLFAGYDYLALGLFNLAGDGQMLLAYAIATALWPAVALIARRYTLNACWKRNTAIIFTTSLTHATLVEIAVAGLRVYGLGRPAGETFGTIFLLSSIGAYLVRSEELGRYELAAQLRVQELARMVSEARLQSLRTQIAPHFLFNTLNSILSMIARDPEGARTMLQRLRRILERTFVCDTRQEVSLREELDLTVSYIEIERIRFRDALDVDIAIDPALLEESVPAFLLQPLVENAVRHGALASLNRGTIRLRAQRTGAMMELSVENDCELVDPSGWREGVGLSNIRSRLDHLYGPAHSLGVEMHQEGKVSVHIRLPLAVRDAEAAG